MGNWTLQSERQLMQVIQLFPPKLKQAMYAASHNNDLKRKTWNNCAFNAASGGSVNSIEAAAAKFDIPQSLVGSFISLWDNREGTDEENSELLRDMIQQIGLFSEPSTEKIKIVRKRVFQAVPLEDLEICEQDVLDVEFLLDSNLQNV